jgi:peptide/nickel transport system substrate-binding protein
MIKPLLATVAILTLPFTSASAANLTVAIDSAVNTLDPHATLSVGSDLSFLSHIFDTLTKRNAKGDIVPAVATEWKLVDPTTWRVTLRDDVTFPSGATANAELVKWNIDRILDQKNALRSRSTFSLIKEAKVISPTEIEITSSKPYPLLPTDLTSLYLLDPSWVENHPTVSEPSGSGPYELQSFRSGDAGVLRLRKNYWGTEKPAFDEVTFRTIPDEAAQLAALQAGEVDVVSGFSPKEIEGINIGGKAKAVSQPSIRPTFVKFNVETGPLAKSPELRQALNYAIDKQSIVDAFFAGHSEVLKGQVLSSPYNGYNSALEPYPYDPQKAIELIAKSGVPADQLNFEFTVPTDAYQSAVDISQFISAQLEEVGVKTTINRLDFAAYMTKYVKDHAMSPLMYLSQGNGTLEAAAIYRLYQTGNVYSYFSDPKLDGLNAAAQSEFDEAKRKAIYVQASEHFREAAPVLFLFTLPRTIAYSSKLVWHERGDEFITAADFTLAK